MKIKTSELTEAALDWAVAKCEPDMLDLYYADDKPLYLEEAPDYHQEWNPSTNWAQGGPIIERERITLDYFPDGGHPQGGEWLAQAWDDNGNPIAEEQSETILVATMRCYVASKLGEEVEVPEELQ